MNHLSTVEAIEAVEKHAYALAPRGEQEEVLCAALFLHVLHSADHEDVQDMAAGDQDAYGRFIDTQELGNRVFEFAVNVFPQLAQKELKERLEASKDALEVEMDLRRNINGLVGNF